MCFSTRLRGLSVFLQVYGDWMYFCRFVGTECFSVGLW